VQVRAWRAAYEGLVPDEVMARRTFAEREARWQVILAERGDAGVAVVATGAAGEVAGFATVSDSARDDDSRPGAVELSALYVDPGHWRAGVGRALLAAARERAPGEMTLWVFEANSGGQAFYRALGFTPDGATGTRSERPTIRLRAPA
jgi:GNAT superfamily N-acetyltransferase